MKILLLDIETSPNLVWTFDLWNANIGPEKIVEPQKVLSYAAKWYGDKEMFYDDVNQSSEKSMLKGIHSLLDHCDAVVHYFGAKFDIPMLNTEFVKHDILPPSPYKQIDLKETVRRKFRFPSGKLVYVSDVLEIGQKLEEGIDFKLWRRCMEGDQKAWELMGKYNRQDTALLEGLYERLRPWISNHPNWGAFQEDKEVCPHCGSKHVHKRGKAAITAKLIQYQRYQCQACGTWFRSTVSLTPKGLEKYVSV